MLIIRYSSCLRNSLSTTSSTFPISNSEIWHSFNESANIKWFILNTKEKNVTDKQVLIAEAEALFPKFWQIHQYGQQDKAEHIELWLMVTKTLISLIAASSLSPPTHGQAVNERSELHIWHSLCIPFTAAKRTLQGSQKHYTGDTNTTKHLLWRSAFGIGCKQHTACCNSGLLSESEDNTAWMKHLLALLGMTHSRAHLEEGLK